MRFKLLATISHKRWDEPILKELYYTADSLDDVLERIKGDASIPPELAHLIHNLRFNRRCAFRDARGIKHSWELKQIRE